MTNSTDAPKTEIDLLEELDRTRAVRDSLVHEHAWLIDTEIPRLVEEHGRLLEAVNAQRAAVARESAKLPKAENRPAVIPSGDLRLRVNQPSLSKALDELEQRRLAAEELGSHILHLQLRRDQVGWTIPAARGDVEKVEQQLEEHRRHLERILQAELGAARRQGRAGFLERLTGRAQP